MAFGEIAKLLASLDLDTKPFERNAKHVDSGLGKMESGLGRLSTKSLALGTAIGTGIERLAEKGIGFLFSQIQQGEEALRSLQDITAQTNAVIKSTGGAAGITAAQIRGYAESLESLTTADDKAIQNAENLLLTFTGIGKKAFPDATKAVVNLGIALAQGDAAAADFKGSAIQVGKALNDPIKGVTALSRVGVSFTEQQIKQIKKLQESGHLYEAQKVILAELSKEFGKAGEAAGKSGAAGVRRLNDAVEDSQLALAQGLAPALEDIRGQIAAGLSDPNTQKDIKNLGVFLGQAAKQGLAFAKSIPWNQVADGLQTAAGFAGKLIDTFAHLPPQVQGTLLALAGLSKLGGGGVIKVGVSLLGEGVKGLLGAFASRGSPANPMFTKELGLSGGGGGVPVPGGKGGISGLGKLFLVGEAIGLIAAVNEVRDGISNASTQQAKDIHQALTSNLADNPQTMESLISQLSAIDHGIQDINSNPLNVLVSGDALTELQQMREQVVTRLGELQKEQAALWKPLPAKQEKALQKVRDGIETAKIAQVSSESKTRTSVDRTRDQIESARIAISSKVQATTSSVATLAGAERSQTSQIVGAIRSNRPIVNLDVRVSGDTVRVTKNYQSGSNIGTPGGPRTGGQQRF